MRGAHLLAVAVLAGCGGPPTETTLDWSAAVDPTPAPASSPPRLGVDGTRLVVAQTQAPLRLRGVNVCSFEFDRDGANWKLRAGGGSGVIDVLADATRWNANVVRVPVNQEWFLTDDAYVARVEQVIDAAAAAGLYVMLDVQWELGRKLEPYHHNILKAPTFGEGNTTEAFWHGATSRWANRTNLLYDLVNEPHDYPDGYTAQAMQALVDAIRRRDDETVIVIAGMNWAHSVDYYRQRPLTGAHLLYSAHQYLPYDRPEDFERNFGAAALELPVVIGEFLAEPENSDYAGQLVDFAETRGVNGWLPWAVGCGFDEGSDLGPEPLQTLARRMRELND